MQNCPGSGYLTDTACHSQLRMHLLIHHLVCAHAESPAAGVHICIPLASRRALPYGTDDPEYGSLTQQRVRLSGGT